MKVVNNTKIIWAIDPFVEYSLQKTAGQAIRGIVGGQRAEIEPVYFWSIPTNASSLIFSGELLRDIRDLGRQRVYQLANKIGLVNVKDLKILQEPALTMSRGVDVLLEYARKKGADLIVASTHSRKGFQRWIMGSFAESLMLKSDLPLLLVNPSRGGPFKFNEIFFPTDFSDGSKWAYLTVLELARRLGGHIHLFHKIDFDWMSPIDITTPSYLEYRTQYFRNKVAQIKGQARAWINLGRAKGIRVDFDLDENPERTISEGFLHKLKGKQGLIALSSQSGQLSALFMGSVARQIVRNAKQPVWVVHSKVRQKIKRGLGKRTVLSPKFRVHKPDSIISKFTEKI